MSFVEARCCGRRLIAVAMGHAGTFPVRRAGLAAAGGGERLPPLGSTGQFCEPRWLNRCGRADVVAVVEPAAVPGWLLFPPREPSPGTAAVRDPGGEHPVADSPAPGLAQARVGGTAARWRTDGLTTREAPWIDAPGVTLPPCPYCSGNGHGLGGLDWQAARHSGRWRRVLRRLRRLLAIGIALGRVIIGRLTGQPDQGGATLYQQLARMLYTPGGPGPAAEAEQAALGVKLAVSYPGAEILRMYSDIAYFGRGYYGLDEAACGYFGVPPAMLSWPQAALLAGLMPAPSVYDPIMHFAAARVREAHVLDRLAAVGALTQAQADRAYHQRLSLIHSQRARARCLTY